MDYASTLKALRSRLVESATGKQLPQSTSPSLESFISSRSQAQIPQESTDDIITRSANWVSEIKKASLEFQKAREAAAPKQSTSPVEGAIMGFLNTRDVIEQKREEPKVAEGRREAFIRRREENSPSTYAPERPSEIKSFKDAIDLTEGGGGYDTLFGFSEKEGKAFAGTRISQMTIGDIKNFASSRGEYGQWVKGQVGRVATPMGRYQFVGSTLTALADEMGLDDNTVFSPEVQDQMFEHYLAKRIRRGKTMPEKIAQVREAWEGFKSIPASTLEHLITQYEAT